MDRVKDYMQFGICFVGLGYIALWPLMVHEDELAMLGSAAFCGALPDALVEFICRPPHALALSPGLHLIGLLSAGAVLLRCLMCRLRRLRRAGTAHAPSLPQVPAVELAPRLPSSWQNSHNAMPPPRPVTPRRQFGLRGVPH